MISIYHLISRVYNYIKEIKLLIFTLKFALYNNASSEAYPHAQFSIKCTYWLFCVEMIIATSFADMEKEMDHSESHQNKV